jgi:hypothetical protein
MPITAIALSNFWDMACSLSLAPLPSILSLVGQEHGRTIPLADLCRSTRNSRLLARPRHLPPRARARQYASEAAGSSDCRSQVRNKVLGSAGSSGWVNVVVRRAL